MIHELHVHFSEVALSYLDHKCRVVRKMCGRTALEMMIDEEDLSLEL